MKMNIRDRANRHGKSFAQDAREMLAALEASGYDDAPREAEVNP